jgi:diguanylate cyclase (GGDEF)-like protein
MELVAVLAVAVAGSSAIGWLAWRAWRRTMRRYADALAAARHEATHDGLTGALTRAAFARELEARLASASPQRPLALLAVDVDGFGQINKLLGHAAGDELLVQLVRTAAGVVRDEDAIGRLGGDEFALLVRGDDAHAIGERILLALRAPGDAQGRGIDVSIGIANAPLDGTSVAALLRAADVAMRRAKRTGKGRVVSYTGESLADREEERARHALAEVIAHERIAMATQPIVDLRSGKIHAYEALARFGIAGDLSTGELFALAERVGMREELDLACLGRGLALLPRRPAGTRLSVNVSSQLLAEPRALERLAACPDLQGLVLEITEEALVRDYAALQLALRPLVERGARVAVDDMGAGYSGLRHAIDLHPTYLKLDRTLVHGIDRDPKRAALVDALLRYAQHAGSHIVAEGVETEGELATLMRLGVPLAQGFLLGRPAPPWPRLARAPERRFAADADEPIGAGGERADAATIGPHTTAEQAHARFAADAQLETLVVLDGERRLLGLLTRHRLLARLGHRFGFALYGQRSVLRVADRHCLALPARTPWSELSSRAMARPSESRHDAIVLLDADGRYLRHLTIRDLLDAAEAQSEERALAGGAAC